MMALRIESSADCISALPYPVAVVTLCQPVEHGYYWPILLLTLRSQNRYRPPAAAVSSGNVSPIS